MPRDVTGPCSRVESVRRQFVSRIGHARHTGSVDSGGILVSTFAMPARSRYDPHVHDEHQLAWAPRGVLSVVTDLGTWMLPPARALWIPSGLPHETSAASQPDDTRSLAQGACRRCVPPRNQPRTSAASRARVCNSAQARVAAGAAASGARVRRSVTITVTSSAGVTSKA
jgi:AraC-like ligand binding domain